FRLSTRQRRIIQAATALTFISIIYLVFSIPSEKPKKYWRIRVRDNLTPNIPEESEESPEIVDIVLNHSNPAIIDAIHIACDDAFANAGTTIAYLKRFAFDRESLQSLIATSSDRCRTYLSSFGFAKSEPSQEEKEFPLAYAVVAHGSFDQLLLVLSSFYESHNAFCISVPSNADPVFIRLVHTLDDCFENIHVIDVGEISWGSYEIQRATYGCMQYLVEQEPVQWRYLQYLSGVDVPLRTNLEMVRIMKEWKGFSHVHTLPYPEERLGGNVNKTPPVALFKSSLSAIVAREAAQVMVHHPKAKELMEFLKPTIVADESFWSSALGNPDVLPVPGAFNVGAFLIEKSEHVNGTEYPLKNCSHAPCLTSGFVGRYQQWQGRQPNTTSDNCKGEWTNHSCVFGVGDLPTLVSNEAFVAHKLYIDFEPAALVCLLKEIKRRRGHPDDRFDAQQYSHLPQIEYARGIPLENLSRKDLIGSA
ncbi:hypothetical protein PENTCL1PPCAC_25478, partial [Pristionchus entomophagus]